MQGVRSDFLLIVVCGGVSELNFVPRYESVIPLDSDTGICSNLCFQDPRSRAGSLGKGTCAFLEKIQGVERYAGAVRGNPRYGRAMTDLRGG